MATVTYTLSGDSVTFAFTPTTAAAAHTYEITYTSGTLTGSTTVAGAGEPGPYYTTITGLEGGQTYNFDWTWVYYDEQDPVPVEQGRISVQTPDDTPKTATVSQWQDLADRVKEKAKITMTNTDPGEGSALSANNYVAVYGGDPITMDYSTTEVNTGVKWIDGSAIYKKTINIGALPNSTTKNTAHNISNLGQVLRIEGFTTNGTNTYELPRVMIGGTQYQAQIQVNSTNIQIDTGDDLSSYTTTYVTLYYTKSS